MAVAKVRCDHALQPIAIPVTRRALVIGGGVAGIQAALDIADAGYQVVLVEREPSIGGKMAGLSETFPTLDCSQCILTPRMVDVGQHPNITLHTYSRGRVGRGLRRQLQGHDPQEGPLRRHGEMHRLRPVLELVPLEEEPQRVRLRHGQPHGDLRALPPGRARPAGDRPRRLPALSQGQVRHLCAKKCQAGAIRFDDEDQLVTEEVGAIVVATGYQLYSIGKEQRTATDRPATANTATAAIPT